MNKFLLEQYLLEVQDLALDRLVLEQYDADKVCVLEEVVTEATAEQKAKARKVKGGELSAKNKEKRLAKQRQDWINNAPNAEEKARRISLIKKAEGATGELAAKNKEARLAKQRKDWAGDDPRKLALQKKASVAKSQSINNSKKAEAGIKEKIAMLANRVKNTTGEAKKKAVEALKVAKGYWAKKAAKTNLSGLYNAKTGEQVIAGIKKYGPMAGATAIAGLAAFGAAKLYKKYFSAAGKACNGDPACMKKYKLAAAMKARQGLASTLSSAKDPKSKAKIQAQIAKWNSKIAKMKG